MPEPPESIEALRARTFAPPEPDADGTITLDCGTYLEYVKALYADPSGDESDDSEN